MAAYAGLARVGYSLSDEGYLLLGTLKIPQGQTPIADIQSYDPGRYYWSAGWMSLLGRPDLTGLRTSIGVLLGLALGATTWMLRHSLGKPGWTVVWVALLLLWMVPRHKGYDIAISLLSVSFGYLLLVRGPRTAFAAGAFVGLAGFFGRNHGLYTGLQLGLVLLVACRMRSVPIAGRAAVFLAGVLTGYSPEWLLFLVKEGFWQKSQNLNELLLAPGAASLRLPVPWPWEVEWSTPVTPHMFFRFATGVGFVLIPSVLLLAGVFLIKATRRIGPWSRADLLLLSATSAAVFYGHHAFSRADLSHLAQGIHPILIAAPCLLHAQMAGGWRLARFTLITGVSLASAAVLVLQPAFWLSGASSSFVPVRVLGERIQIDASTASLIARVSNALNGAGAVGPDARVLIAPHWPGLYPALNLQCPTYNFYFVFPETVAIQKQMIREMESSRVTHVVLSDTTIDGREELRFPNTQTLLMRHIERNYTTLADQGAPFSIWTRTSAFRDDSSRHRRGAGRSPPRTSGR